MKKLVFVAIMSVLMISCNENKKEQEKIKKDPNLEVHEKIAMANGFENFDSISKLKFTFNVKVNDTIRSERSWAWNIKSGKISLTEKDSTMSYVKKDSLAKDKEYIDQRFINDSYWLLFPYQLKWSNADLSEVKTAKAPISNEEMQMLTASFPAEGGYTPGDSYDIYFNKDYMIQEWVYKAADGDREMATTWEDYEDFNGVKISKMHKSEDGNFQLYFTDISVE
ncbi:hypothetical protein [Gramella sp. MAR_2010_147]|uniref:hypothetical protein n=1 Tax=Gramella sp. MAR_2010_147 TaxID=1250205 RepID=UPI00087A9190|nr:hypothetical protein [Gramella sp. MAR_2010_147]SDS60726.1 hypothetical protein SAMN04488553_2650 [Gramella sp. MAR_2010_147]